MTHHEEGQPAVTAQGGLETVALAECALLLRPDDDVAVTTRELPAGTRVLTAVRELVLPGDVPRIHKLAMDDTERTHEFGTARTQLPAAGPPRTFQGYHRANGRVGTRNFVGVLTSVNCSASSATMIADQFRGMALDAFPNVDGVIALTHQSGCGLVPGSVGANT